MSRSHTHRRLSQGTAHSSTLVVYNERKPRQCFAVEPCLFAMYRLHGCPYHVSCMTYCMSCAPDCRQLLYIPHSTRCTYPCLELTCSHVWLACGSSASHLNKPSTPHIISSECPARGPFPPPSFQFCRCLKQPHQVPNLHTFAPPGIPLSCRQSWP